MTRVALLWHMHQPFYQDLVTGEHILPWVRLHGLKDYWGMVALLREFPSVRVTFNLVPSLLVQLDAFAKDEARDPHLELGLKPAEQLSEDERAFCVENFFHAHRPRMIDPYPRYAELLDKRGSVGLGLSARAQAALFSVDDIRDLQVWHKLVWMDPFYLDEDPRLKRLVEKGRDFSETDKQTLRAVELELLQRVVPEYREAVQREQIEISTSPFYHPILPLLCNTDIYLRTHPSSRMPRERFRHPEDAAEQLRRAVELHERLFGKRPDGLWPSEGSVSDDMVPLVVQAGFKWMATDEEILARTLGRGISRDGGGNVEQSDLLYRPYVVGRGATVACGFRDHSVSDLIGFVYSSWSPDHAAGSFVDRLVEAGRRYSAQTNGEEATIFVILDGENAWEHYEGQGRPFLRALYGRLATHPELRTVTMAEACATAREPLPSIFPGSWINGDFYIWIGHADDHRAWTQLVDARRALDAVPPGLSEVSLARAREEMLIAEGSDWFWWYGDDHSSDHDLEFDELFRRHVRNVYRALELPIPEELFVSNITTQPPAVEIQQPTGFIRPTIDGRVTSYFEWVGAGCFEISDRAGAMHQVSAQEAGLSVIEFGFDLNSLYLRIDGTSPMRELLGNGFEVSIKFLKPAGLRVVIDRLGARLSARRDDGVWIVRLGAEPVAAVGTVVEARIPFADIGVHAAEALAFVVAITSGELEVQRYPKHRPIEIEVPGPGFVAANWTA